MKTAGVVVVALLLFGVVVLGTRQWILTRRQVSRQETDARERRKWWLRVFLLRLIGVLWYESHRRKTDVAR